MARRGTPPHPANPPRRALTELLCLPARLHSGSGLRRAAWPRCPVAPWPGRGAEHGPLPPSVRPAGSPLPAPPPPAAPPPRATAAAVKATARRHHVVGPWGRHGPRDLAGREGRRGKGRDGTRCPSWGIPVAWTCWSGPPGPEAGERKRAKESLALIFTLGSRTAHPLETFQRVLPSAPSALTQRVQTEARSKSSSPAVFGAGFLTKHRKWLCPPEKIKEGASTVLNGEEQLECQQLEGPSSAQRRVRARPMGAPPSCHVQIWSSFKPRPVSCSPSSPVRSQVHLRILQIKLLVPFNICCILWTKKTEKCLRTCAVVLSLRKYIKIW
ncbi:uncharacterized protein LOC123934152 [Meles meles]|uniref:uncharacterized protein LOC123934152 n=1 Tax=Meles meles TaxID=9662 RepID=UPI001E69D781|nr:uncharacterized protein LOC123934152 [Meles meles]